MAGASSFAHKKSPLVEPDKELDKAKVVDKELDKTKMADKEVDYAKVVDNPNLNPNPNFLLSYHH